MSAVDTVARTIWAEARNQGTRGMEAVGCVIAKRAANPRWWGRGFEGVCKAKAQFSCWNEGDPNRAKLLKVDARNAQFREATRIAELVVSGKLKDITNGADHYYTPLAAFPPAWARKVFAVAVIGDHVF